MRTFKRLNKKARLFLLKEVIVIRLSKSVEVFMLALKNGQPAENAADDEKKRQEDLLKKDIPKRADAETDTSVDKPPDPEQEKKLNKWWLDYNLDKPIFNLKIPSWTPPEKDSEFEIAKSISQYLIRFVDILNNQKDFFITPGEKVRDTVLPPIKRFLGDTIGIQIERISVFLDKPVDGFAKVLSNVTSSLASPDLTAFVKNELGIGKVTGDAKFTLDESVQLLFKISMNIKDTFDEEISYWKKKGYLN